MSNVACCVRNVSKKTCDVHVCLMLIGGGSASDAWRNLLGS